VKPASVQMLDAYPICNNLPMCGRYRLSRRKQLVEEYFDTAVSDEPDWNPRYTSYWDLYGPDHESFSAADRKR
jgi:hypothetical protein